MRRTDLVLLAAGGSLAMLLAALGFQFIADMAPCKLCYWQRYPHVVAVVIGAVALLVGGRLLPFAGFCAALTTAGVGLYHAGVEQKFWPGPTSCSSGDITGLSTDELLDQIMSAPLVRCDDIPWEFLGLSMAAWNAVVSAVLALIWLRAMLRG